VIVESANDPRKKEFVRKKFEYLFGRPRVFQLSNIKDEMAVLGKILTLKYS
jgi:hypothetical protein